MTLDLNKELLLSLAYFGGGTSGGGGGGGVTSYGALTGKPHINGVEVLGNHDLEYYEQSVTVLVRTSGWSSATTTVDGTAYYTNTVSVADLFDSHPDVNLDAAPGRTIPTVAQREAFGIVAKGGYITADKTAKTLTLYAQEKPTADFYIFIKGAK